MVKRIIWTSRAEQIFTYILEFYIQRNKSKTYSKKLNSEIKKLVQLLSKHPFLGRKSALPNIRILIKGNFNIIYKIYPEEIVILLFWDTRQNPNKLKDFLSDLK